MLFFYTLTNSDLKFDSNFICKASPGQPNRGCEIESSNLHHEKSSTIQTMKENQQQLK